MFINVLFSEVKHLIVYYNVVHQAINKKWHLFRKGKDSSFQLKVFSFQPIQEFGIEKYFLVICSPNIKKKRKQALGIKNN